MRNEMAGYTIADIILWKIIYNSVGTIYQHEQSIVLEEHMILGTE